MTNPTYTTTKTFLDWLKEVRPDFEVKSDCDLYFDGKVRHYHIAYVGPRRRTKLITLESLHAILWELFECIDFSDNLWFKYTNDKESMWFTNPESVLEDIMKTYDKWIM